jgi:hypothetical protein
MGGKQEQMKLHEDDWTECFDNQRRTRLGCSPSHRARHCARSIYHPHQLKHGINDLVSFSFYTFSFLFSLFSVVALPFPASLSSFPGSHVRTFPPFLPAFP